LVVCEENGRKCRIYALLNSDVTLRKAGSEVDGRKRDGRMMMIGSRVIMVKAT